MQPSTPLTSVHELLYYTCTIFMQEMKNILLDNVTSRTRMEALELYLHTSLRIETNNDVVSNPFSIQPLLTMVRRGCGCGCVGGGGGGGVLV